MKDDEKTPQVDDDQKQQQQGDGDTPPADGGDTTNWEAKYKEILAEKRSWEKKSRANHKAATAANDTASDAIARAEAAEKELADLKAEKARNGLIAEIAKDKGVDASLLARMIGDDREAIEANADALAAIPKPNSYQNTASVKDKGEPAHTPGKTYDDIRDIKRQSDRIHAMLENPGAILNK